MLLGTAMFVVAALAQSPDAPRGTLALVGGTVYVNPSEKPIRDAVVLVREGKIVAVGSRASLRVPPGAETLDCLGLTITAGLWNSHVHFFERKWAEAATLATQELERQIREMITRYGFTSVFDLGSPGENTRRLRRRIESGEVAGPFIRSTGEGLLPPGAAPSDTVLSMMGSMKIPLAEVADAGEAAAASRKLLAEGVDGIKLFASAPRGAALPQSVIEAAVNEAHRAGKPVFVHPNSGADVLTAVRAGVDVIAHTTPQSGPWDETLLAAMRERGVALTPTLTIWKHYARHDRASAQDRVVSTEVGQLRAWLAAGGTVLFGTDLGAAEYDPTEEYRLMAQAGMTFPQVLASLTTAPAQRFGAARDAGQIAPGFQADLAVFRGDPARDIRALAAVQYTVRAGKILYRAGQ